VRTARFTISGLPPSLNRHLGKHWWLLRGRDGAASAWHDRAVIAMMVARRYGLWDGHPFPRARVTFRFWLPDRRRRDLDNFVGGMKAGIDAMRPAVFADDDVAHVPVLVAEYAGVDAANPRVEVEVVEVEELEPVAGVTMAGVRAVAPKGAAKGGGTKGGSNRRQTPPGRARGRG